MFQFSPTDGATEGGMRGQPAGNAMGDVRQNLAMMMRTRQLPGMKNQYAQHQQMMAQGGNPNTARNPFMSQMPMMNQMQGGGY